MKANVRYNVDRLRNAAPILSDLADKEVVRGVGGVYDLATGKVEFLDTEWATSSH